jgi:AraC family transcriptional regulator
MSLPCRLKGTGACLRMNPAAPGAYPETTTMLRKLPAGSFYGKTTLRREVSGLVFAESVYREELRIPKHEHANAFLNLVLEGTYTEVCGSRTRTRGPSTLALHPSGEVHADDWHGVGGHVFHVEISPSRLEHVRAYSPVLDTPQDFLGGLPVWIATRLYQEHCRNDGVSSLVMEGLVLEILAECSRRCAGDPERKPPGWLQRVRELLDVRFAENLTHEVVAAAAGIHPVHLARVFRQHYGCTLGDYVRKLRLDFAARQLIITDEPLIGIAYAAGFSDQSHFTRTFKRQTGMTPAAFRSYGRSR